MKVVAIWTQSANGFLNIDQHKWKSTLDYNWFTKVSKKTGVLIKGRKTFEAAGGVLKDRLNVVMTRDPDKIKMKDKNLLVTSKSPREILQDLEKQGFKEVVIAGGRQIYSMFLREGLVDEVWMTVQPVFLKEGFGALEGVEVKMKLKKIDKLEDGVVTLKYRVL